MAEVTIPEKRPGLRVSATPAASTANITLISIRVTRMDGKPGVHQFGLWLSDSPTGAGHTAFTATGAVAPGASGLLVDTQVAKKALTVQTNAAGLFILSITDTAKTPFVIVVEIEGRAYPLATLTTANYG